MIQLDNGRDRSCRGWQANSSASVVQIVITASVHSPTAKRDSRDLHGLLQNAMRNGGAWPQTSRCHGNFHPGVDGCWASHHPGAVRRLLVWVSDDRCSPPPFPLNILPWDQILTLLPAGTSPALLPPPADQHVASVYTPGNVAPKVPEVLIAAGINSDAFRLFISYRHDDCSVFAEQLFDALSHEHFDVYLDRFRTAPGSDFIERIRYELVDKACVVILDSENVAQSDWVRGEHAFARRYRLGLLAIDLPGGARTFPNIRRRLDFAGRAPIADFRSNGLPGDVAQAVAFVRDHYAAETGRRLRYQRRIIRSAGAAAGVATAWRPDGMFDVHPASGGASYVVAASARPPVTEAFRRTCGAASISGAKAVVVGPLEAHLRGGRQDADWLAGTSGSAVVDERRLYKAMRRMRNGHL